MREKISACELTSQNSILRINDKKTMQLILEYKKEECLWNSTLDDYPNKSKRVKAADKIAKILNIKNFEGKHVMIKFKNLRNSYSQELKKIKQSIDELGPNSPVLYRPKVQWFPLMDSFLRPHLQPARPSQVVTHHIPAREKTPKEMIPEVKMECFEIVDEPEDWTIQTAGSATTATYSQSETSEIEESSNDSRAKVRRLSTSSGPNDNYNQNQIFLPANDVSTVVAPSEDTYDNFGKYIASLLRNLPPQKALRVQPKIVDMIVNYSIKKDENIQVVIDRLGEETE